MKQDFWPLGKGGEGILDCLYREAGEELGQEVEVLRQFHTSETFQASRYRTGDQIICVYYTCRLPRNSEGRRLPVFRASHLKIDIYCSDKRGHFYHQAGENKQ